jgi:hypothetical protein
MFASHYNLFRLYSNCALEASRALRKNWIIIPASLILFLSFSFVLSLIGKSGSGIAGGFMAGLLEILALTLYFSWLQETVQKGRLVPQELLKFDYAFFSAILNVGFILFIAQLLLAAFAQSATSMPLAPLLSFVAIILFNPIAEIIVNEQADGLNAFTNAYQFVIEYWIEWFLPFALILLPWIVVSPAGPLAGLSQTNPLLPAGPLVWGTEAVAGYVLGNSASIPAIFVGLVLANWFMVFRSLLFRELSSGSRRQRDFWAKKA